MSRTRAWRLAATHSARSARGSPRSSGRARRHTAATSTTRSRPCPPVSQRRTRARFGTHRAGSEKRPGRPRHKVTVMTIALQYYNITVNDVDESIAFYGDALGLQVRNDVPSDGFRWVTLGSDAQPGLEIVLSVPHAGRSQADGDALQELLTKGVLPIIVFRSDDVDATFETVRASGAEVLQEPIDQSWGPRDCAFRDPSGNTVRIAQAPAI